MNLCGLGLRDLFTDASVEDYHGDAHSVYFLLNSKNNETYTKFGFRTNFDFGVFSVFVIKFAIMGWIRNDVTFLVEL